MAIQEASSVSLGRLDHHRLEIPQSRLETVGYLGAGAFAVVSLVHDPVEDKLYALKAMSKHAIVEQNLKGMVVGERNALAELGDSPFVVRLITTYKDDNCIYLLMEPALGGELFGLYSDYEWYGDEQKASFFTACVALGIDHIHSKKIIHRDIKLENVLLDEKGYARVTDLGIAKVVIGKTYTVCGTSDYLAPETLKQAGHNRAVDWWALGILAYAMTAGRMPFDAGDVLQIYKNIVKGFRKEHFPSTFSADLVDFVKSLCRKKPQERITMLPGGVKNLAKHPWIASGDSSRWDQIAARTRPPPWAPTPISVEERRATMKQNHDVGSFEPYVDDGTDWDAPF
jgi:serine/threonine protein kinase